MQRLPLTQKPAPTGAPIGRGWRGLVGEPLITILTPGSWLTFVVHVVCWIVLFVLWMVYVSNGAFKDSDKWADGNRTDLQGTGNFDKYDPDIVQTWYQLSLAGPVMIGLSVGFILLHSLAIDNKWNSAGGRFLADFVTTGVAFLLVGGLGLTWLVTNYAIALKTDDAHKNRGWMVVIMLLHSFVVGHALVNLAQFIATNARDDPPVRSRL